MDVKNKTSDEILQELFSALNVPLSPKVKEEPPWENLDNSIDSEVSEEKEADTKSSESEAECKEKEEHITKNHKHKSSKKKKEKKKKKKKHKKKDDDGRHKSKKKHRKGEGSPPAVTVPKVEVKSEALSKEADIIFLEQTEKCVSNIEVIKVEVKEEELKQDLNSKAELLDKTLTQNGKRRSDTNSDSGEKEDISKNPTKKLKSPQRSHSSSKSLCSRSRSRSKVRHQRSRSRSRQGRHSRSRSHSRSKHNNRHSRSSSRKKSSIHKSKAKSPGESDRVKHRKSSRSHSRSYSPKSSKRRRYSRSRSRSVSSKNTRRKSSRSHSKSLSPKYSRRKRYQSPSPSPVKLSKRRSRSRSGSHKKIISKAISDSLTKAIESSSKDEKSLEIDLSSIPTPDVQQTPCPVALPIALESIPLPIPPVSTEVQDPSSIPLPQPVVPSKEQLNGKDHSEDKEKEIDLGAIPVPGYVAETAAKDQEPLKPTDTGVEKSKAKTIIIKSLKDSLIYMQAQEEAERRAKVKQDDEEKIVEESVEKSNGELEDSETVEQQTEDTTEGDAVKESVQAPEELEPIAPKKSKSNDHCEVEDGEIVSENANEVEEGEIISENDKEEISKSKSHKKKSKKDKDKNKEKKKSKREKSKDKKKQAKERSKSKERSVKSRSKSKERSKHKKSSSWHRDRDADRRYRRYSRSRSHSRDRHSRFRHRSYSRSRSRSRSRSGRKRDCVSDLRDKVTRKRLLEIARRNAVYLMQNGCLPLSVEQEQLVKIKTGGKSVEELTDFCKQLVASGNYSDAELSDPSPSSDEDDNNPDKPFSCTRHPFSVRDSKPILMNIRNAPMLPTKTNAERLADHAKLREQFPVSSGSLHRNKGEVNTTEDKLRSELWLASPSLSLTSLPTSTVPWSSSSRNDSGWVPVSPKEKNKKEEDIVFSKEKPPAVDISQIVSSRLSAMRKLQDNPNDMEALKTLHNVQKDMQTWALSKQEPGQFTGTTGVKILSQEELCAGHQAWVRKEQLKEAAPVRPQFGLKMLQKMGWTPGEGLGKNKEGAIEPLLLDVKMDKKGFHAQEELTPKKQPIPMAKDLSGKHPVSALVELCSKHKWQPPEFEMVFDYGPDHKKNFLMKVKVNGQEYKPAVAGPTKKLAKAAAAAACLQSLGLMTRDPEYPFSEAT